MFGYARCGMDGIAFERCLGTAACHGAPNPAEKGKYYDIDGTDWATVDSNESCSSGHAPRANNSRCYECASGFVPGASDGECIECVPSASIVVVFFILCLAFLLFFILVADRVRAAGE